MRLFYSFLFYARASAQRRGVDSIWSARYVVTMDPQHRVIENGAIAITGDHIVAVGTRAADRQRLSAPSSASTGPMRFSRPV